jgi:serine/threonine protein kinase
METSQATDPQLGKMYGLCRLERKLGEGGMGVVYLAIHTGLARPVAVKLLRPEGSADPRAAERFLREARAAARVDHPSVIQVHDIGRQGDTFFIVMQYVEGCTLEGVLAQEGRLPLAEAIRITRAVCEGLGAAHSQRTIHRDIKPDNILLGKDGTVKITDFGLARALEGDPNLSQSGRILGTPHYMSPEQALGGQIDCRTDIFSLGSTFYRMLTGRHPFAAKSVMAVVYKLSHETPPPVRELNPSVPGPISDLIKAMMARRPEHRIGTAAEVIRRLDAFARGARRPSHAPGTSAARPVIRRPAPRSGRGVLILGAVVLATVGASFIFRAELEPLARWAAAEARQLTGELSAGINRRSDGSPAESAPAEQLALKRRGSDFLKDVRSDSQRMKRYLDPSRQWPVAGEVFKRSYGSLCDSSKAKSLRIREVQIGSGGRSAEMTIVGGDAPIVLRWIKRGGEWYFLPVPRQ